MNKIFSSHIITTGIFSFLLCMASQDVSAAQLTYTVVPNNKGRDTATLVEVRIDPEGKNINVIEGGITFAGISVDSLSVEINKENSALTLWPVEPVYNADERMIRFVGGTPEGLTKEGLVFTLRILTTSADNIDISWSGVKTYLNDGKGTEESTSVKSISLNMENKDSQSASEEINNKKEKSVDENTIFSGFSTKNSGILLLVIILLSALLYGYKKSIKK
jgi:hypothetical protein